MMPAKEYMQRWDAILAAASVRNDATFWRLYADFLNASCPISRERNALRDMSVRAAKAFAMLDGSVDWQ